ncbi:DMT family transporter [Pseudomonas sp. FP597]|uniref:DMT family transporter n=1 Tax=Pseudomonas sp. FP597 TaxID=2954096 RepID=UPI00273449A6|nr:DMT family transporter [Pseudomonas sp. FP597]WLI07435.1 DMT family transporter [Pseudomonas sp. FP597]
MKISAITQATLAMAILCMMDPLVKSLATRYPVMEIAFFRFAGGLVVSALLALYFRPAWPDKRSFVTNGARSVLVAISVLTLFYSLKLLPIATAVAVSFISPVVIVVLAVLVLGERLTLRILFALVLGISGLLLILGNSVLGVESTTASWIGVAAGIISAVAYAVSMIILRSRATQDPIVTIIIFQNLTPTLLLLIPCLILGWIMPDYKDLLIFLCVGLLGASGHYLLAQAFSRANASKLAPVEYTALVWGVFYGFVFFNEWPQIITIIGAAAILLGVITLNHTAPQSLPVNSGSLD